jgi:endonuclease/exonuclease/phosphatase family metal-dependent hydrolase
MSRWLTRIALTFLAVLLGLFAALRFQGLQYFAAYSGAGLARPLPTATVPAHDLSCNTAPLNVLTYNVMYGSAFIEAMAARFRRDGTGAGELPWSARLPEIRERIASFAPDLLGLQEMGEDADIAAIVPSTDYALVSYHLGGFQYGDSALLFKTARFALLDSGQLWLSPTPDLPMSLGFKKLGMVRYANWALLRDKASGFSFMFVNTHFDNAGVNKEPASALFRERIAKLAQGLPLIVTGDFNTKASETERYGRFSGTDVQPPLLQNAYTLAHEPAVDSKLHPNQRIDHILAGGPCKVEATQWRVDTRPLRNGQPMSDHDPIFAQLRFSN